MNPHADENELSAMLRSTAAGSAADGGLLTSFHQTLRSIYPPHRLQVTAKTGVDSLKLDAVLDNDGSCQCSRAPVKMSMEDSLMPAAASPEFAPLPTAERWTLIGAITAITASGWIWMLYMDWAMRDMMRGGGSTAWMPPPTGVSGWSGYDFWMLFVMWAVMMVAMMTPSAIPMLRMYRVLQRNRSRQTLEVTPWMIFLIGYLASWTLFSAIISVVQWPLHEWGLLDPMMDSRSQLFSGILLVVAGLYQWTPWKDACLTLCRAPMQFLLAHWKDGKSGALRMSFEHGFYCIGCCWALMLVLFAVGMMNMLWVAAIMLFVIIEKALPSPARLFRAVTGLLLAGSGIWLSSLHLLGVA